MSPCNLVVLAGVILAIGSAMAQPVPPPARVVPASVTLRSPDNAEPAVPTMRTVLRAEGAAWVRVRFGESQLPGVPGLDAWSITITSTRDGAVQHLDREHLAYWSNTSAYFNGDEVIVELVSRGHAGPASVEIASLIAGEADDPGAYEGRSICGGVDDRVLWHDPVVARMMPSGCTAWIVNDATRSFLSAGHCALTNESVAQFNVPLSTPQGALQHPPPSDQYPVDPESVQAASGSVGNDWAYFGCFPNSETGLCAYRAQGACLYLAQAGASADLPVRVTGYGTIYPPVSWTWNRVQTSHVGVITSVSGNVLSHVADTTGGNSGSPIIVEPSRTVMGIHTHGGCTTTGGANAGTSIHHDDLRAAIKIPRGVCASGVSLPAGPLWAACDVLNQFGQVDEQGRFGARGWMPPGVVGMTYDGVRDRVVTVDTARVFRTIDPENGTVAVMDPQPTVSCAVIGLGFDPTRDRLLALCADGQLLAFTDGTSVPVSMGSSAGAGVQALDADPRDGTPYALSRVASGMRLLRFDLAAEAWMVVGSLGQPAMDCHALACTEDGRLFTIDLTSGALVRIDPITGLGTVVGPTGGYFGAALGMAGVPVRECIATDFNGDGAANGTDMEELELIIGGAADHPDADVNQDGALNGLDIEAYERRLGGDCT
ncbi:MAG: hypothetical protein HBSAPP03_20180 [Phycisphaerae bacterium]|nr:MAG: hypothetical protein HBSAPP03_20180 [Phycisphaerae bacterium]